jgi:hypothetical protein
MSSILKLIEDMGKDARITIQDIEAFVDECVVFLKKHQEDHELDTEIFELERVRHLAIRRKL